MDLREFLGWLLFGVGYLGIFLTLAILLGTNYAPYFSASILIIELVVSVVLLLLGLSIIDEVGERDE